MPGSITNQGKQRWCMKTMVMDLRNSLRITIEEEDYIDPDQDNESKQVSSPTE